MGVEGVDKAGTRWWGGGGHIMKAQLIPWNIILSRQIFYHFQLCNSEESYLDSEIPWKLV